MFFIAKAQKVWELENKMTITDLCIQEAWEGDLGKVADFRSNEKADLYRVSQSFSLYPIELINVYLRLLNILRTRAIS